MLTLSPLASVYLQLFVVNFTFILGDFHFVLVHIFSCWWDLEFRGRQYSKFLDPFVRFSPDFVPIVEICPRLFGSDLSHLDVPLVPTSAVRTHIHPAAYGMN
jgi:hypothetical protein